MEKFKETGLKLTPQRLAILDYLEGNAEHPSAEDVYRAVAKKFPTMSFATVYNTLEALRRRGSVLELTIDPGKKRFDPNTQPHHHLICLRCRRIVDILGEYDLNLSDERKNDFDIIGNHIEFYGICPKCKRTESES
ncbi:MAG: transcriptional repressor [Nitrospirales bacterium]|nr:transcriptional repressor [Nitrospirales bacterium]